MRVIEAAGGVVWRRTAKGEVKVLLVHRPRYDDWSLPKGKLARGESHRQAAVREVREETGLVCNVGDELRQVRYRDLKGRPKRVRFWAMEHVGGTFAASDEVDATKWVSLDSIDKAATYARDVKVVADLFALVGTG
jgi:8-oxo-dGTP diphosphatase